MTSELPSPEAERATRRRAWLAGSILAFLYLACALPALSAYGPTWDCVQGEYPDGERLLAYLTGGGAVFLDLTDMEHDPPVRAPHPDFEVPRHRWTQVYPLGGLLSAISCRLLWTGLGLVPAMQAHNAVVPLLVGALLVVLVVFAAPRMGLGPALAGAGLLVVCPVFFAHAENNLKDVPETCFYVAASVAGFAAFCTGRRGWWVALGLLCGLALAQKPNALFLPAQLGLLFAAGLALPSLRRRAVFRWSTAGFLCALGAFLVSFYAPSPRFWSAPIAGPRAVLDELQRMGNTYSMLGVARVSFEAVIAVLGTTPPVVLALALLGLLAPGPPAELRLFLTCGLVVPIGRTLLPGMRNFDGVRHFIEFLPYLCLAAGLGLRALQRLVTERVGRGAPGRACTATLYAVALGLPALETLRTHPNGICYYNAFAGGLAGAQARGDESATDFWGNSYWQGLGWLNLHAERDAAVIVPIAGFVARSAAPVRLRADLSLSSARLPAYVMYVTRRAKYGRFVLELERRAQPVHEIRVQGGVILRIFLLRDDAFGREMLALWRGQSESREGVQRRLFTWVRLQPDAEELMRTARTALPGEMARLLLPRLPQGLRDDLEKLQWDLEEE